MNELYDAVAAIQQEIRGAAAHRALRYLERRIHDLEIRVRDAKPVPPVQPARMASEANPYAGARYGTYVGD